MSDKKTVTVKALEDHTGFGKSHKAGDTYEIDAEFLETVLVQGKAALVDEPAKDSAVKEPAKARRGER